MKLSYEKIVNDSKPGRSDETLEEIEGSASYVIRDGILISMDKMGQGTDRYFAQELDSQLYSQTAREKNGE